MTTPPALTMHTEHSTLTTSDTPKIADIARQAVAQFPDNRLEAKAFIRSRIDAYPALLDALLDAVITRYLTQAAVLARLAAEDAHRACRPVASRVVYAGDENQPLAASSPVARSIAFERIMATREAKVESILESFALAGGKSLGDVTGLELDEAIEQEKTIVKGQMRRVIFLTQIRALTPDDETVRKSVQPREAARIHQSTINKESAHA